MRDAPGGVIRRPEIATREIWLDREPTARGRSVSGTLHVVVIRARDLFSSSRKNRTRHNSAGGAMVSREADPLSARAVLAGVLVGFVVSAMNVSFGLKAGWAQGGSVLSAAISIGFFAALRPEVPFSPLEANICQTVASAAGSMTMAAGLIGPIPALHMLGLRYGVLTLMIWGASVAFLGVFMAVPLRKHFLVDAPLRFPSGTATAETIRSMFADATRAKEQITTLIRAAAAASALTVLTWAVPWILRPPLLAAAGFPKLAALGFGVRVDATLVGGGVLMGVRVGLSILMGSWFAYGILAPYAESRGWVSGDPLNVRGGARGLLLWPGVAAMAADSLAQLAAPSRPRWRCGGVAERGEKGTQNIPRTRAGWATGTERATVTRRGARPRRRAGGSVLSRRRRRRARLFSSWTTTPTRFLSVGGSWASLPPPSRRGGR